MTLGRTLKGKLEKEEEEGAEKAAKIRNLEDTISEKESVIIKSKDEINKLVSMCQSYRNHLEQWFSNWVSRHICVSQTFSSVSPKKILRIIKILNKSDGAFK
jgi:sugar-specific transcriptional regulator TrmB